MNPRCSPQRVRGRHLADKSADLTINGWAAVWSRFRTSGPSAAKPIATPPHNGVWLNDRQRRAPIWPDSGQDDPKQAVARLAVRAPGRPLHRRQLLPQRQGSQDQFLMSPEDQRHRVADHDEQLQHPSIVAGVEAKINCADPDEF